MKKLFHAAIDSNNVNQVKGMLHMHPELLNTKDEKGMFPFHKCVVSGRHEIGQLLLSLGANAELISDDMEKAYVEYAETHYIHTPLLLFESNFKFYDADRRIQKKILS